MKHYLALSVILTALFSQATHAPAAILLDNTNELTATGFHATLYGLSHDSDYQRIRGYSFEVGATSYDATAMSLPLDWNDSGVITPTIRIQVWELPDLTALIPAPAAVPFYTQDYTPTLSSTTQYFTFALTNGPLNLKANTRYSIGFSTTKPPTQVIYWRRIDPDVALTSSLGLTAKGPFGSNNTGATFSFSSAGGGFQLTGTPVAVPEPSTWALAIVGGGGAAWGMARRRRAAGRVRQA